MRSEAEFLGINQGSNCNFIGKAKEFFTLNALHRPKNRGKGILGSIRVDEDNGSLHAAGSDAFRVSEDGIEVFSLVEGVLGSGKIPDALFKRSLETIELGEEAGPGGSPLQQGLCGGQLLPGFVQLAKDPLCVADVSPAIPLQLEGDGCRRPARGDELQGERASSQQGLGVAVAEAESLS